MPMSKTKIAVVYHKDAYLTQNEIFMPICVGNFSLPDTNVFCDSTGDNISSKNATYNEMTAVYWLWKNYDKIGNPDYIGLNHYRRYFIFKGSKYAYFEDEKLDDTIFNKLNYKDGIIEDIFTRYDFVVPMPNKRKSVYYNYKVSHCIEDLDLVIDIIKKDYKQFVPAMEKYINGNSAYFYNMFILKKDDFFDYCSWIFDIMQQFEEKTKYPNERYFISECLTGIYFTYMKLNGKNAAQLPVLFIKDKKLGFKQARQMCKQNLKNKKMSKLYAYKPLITYFTPNHLLLKRKRKSTLKKKDIFVEK